MASEHETALLLIDLDRFKEVNDRFGRPVGDLLLCRVAERLRRHVRSRDRVARLGGDEFAIVHTGTSVARQAAELAERLLRILAEPYDLDGIEVIVGASIGIACGDGESGDPQEMVTDADTALQYAKAQGRGVFCLYQPGLRRPPPVPAQARAMAEAES